MGGIVGTQMLTLVTVKFFVKFNYLICPEYNLRLTPFVYDLECVHDVIYTEQIPFEFFGMFTFYLTQFEIHTAIISLFASFIAPFGGFFGSGLKRALKIKDFSTLIPEHGGLTDRFDCSMLMQVITYVYVFNIVFRSTPSMVLMALITKLDTVEQLNLYNTL